MTSVTVVTVVTSVTAVNYIVIYKTMNIMTRIHLMCAINRKTAASYHNFATIFLLHKHTQSDFFSFFTLLFDKTTVE